MPEFDQSGADARVSIYGKNLVAGDTPIKVDTSASLQVNTEGQKATYTASTNELAPGATPQDMVTLYGSASKTVRITRIRVSAIATAASVNHITLVVRSTAAAGGTSTVLTAVPHDSNSTAATAIVRAYTAAPTYGTQVGKTQTQYLSMSTVAGAIPIVPVIFDFGNRPEQCLVLRGVAQGIGVSFVGSVLPAGAIFDIEVTWVEE